MSSTSVRSLKLMPEPATRSFMVRETRTSPPPATQVATAPAAVDPTVLLQNAAIPPPPHRGAFGRFLAFFGLSGK